MIVIAKLLKYGNGQVNMFYRYSRTSHISLDRGVGFSANYIRRLRYNAWYNQLQKESFFAHKGSLHSCKISNKKLRFQIKQWNLWSLYVKMSLRDLNSFSVFFNQFGRLLLHLFPATFIKRQWPCSSVSRLFFLSFAMNLKQFLFS